MESEVTIQLPASTSNCGPGFDTLSIALGIYEFVRLRPRKDTLVEAERGSEASPRWLAMALAARERFHSETGTDLIGFDFDIWGEIPNARGLGHSAVLRAGILNALNELHGKPLEREALIRMTAALDSAGDDAAAVHNGGFNVVRSDPETGSYLGSLRYEVPETLAMVVVAPAIRVHTADARDALPDTLAFNEAVRSMNSAAYITAIFASGDYERLRHGVTDYLHQSYRQRLCPFVPEAIEAGVNAGALAGWLSGSGSSVLCIAHAAEAKTVGAAVDSVFKSNDIDARVFHTQTDNQGLRRV